VIFSLSLLILTLFTFQNSLNIKRINAINAVKKILTTCQPVSGDGCMKELIAQSSPTLTMVETANLVHTTLLNDINKGDCHTILHSVGTAYQTYKNTDINKALPIYCDRSLLHGVLIGAGKIDDQKTIRTIFTVNCDPKNGDYIPSCYHGYGHSLSAQKKLINDILPSCSHVIDSGSFNYLNLLFTCLEGYTMDQENFLPITKNVFLPIYPVKNLSRINLIKECSLNTENLSRLSLLEKKELNNACYIILLRYNGPFRIKALKTSDAIESFANENLTICSQISDPYLLADCARQIGSLSFYYAKINNQFTPAVVHSFCLPDKYSKLLTSCISGYVEQWLHNNGGIAPLPYVTNLCTTFGQKELPLCLANYHSVINVL